MSTHDSEPQEQQTPDASPRIKRKPVLIASILTVVVIVAGVGFFFWHEQPSFCNAICHEPMDTYVEGYFSNDVNVLASTHQQSSITCLQCHEATLGEQVAEGTAWISGNYTTPLEKRDFASEETCLKSGCHNMTRQELTQATSNLERNPHDWSMHGTLDFECGDCHSMHGQQIDRCAGCHGDIQVTPGWVVPTQAS